MRRLLKSRIAKVMLAVITLGVIAGAGWLMLTGDDGASNEEFDWDERSPTEVSAEVEVLREGVMENREATNEAIRAVNETHLALDAIAEQVGALLQAETTVNPAILELQVQQLAETVQELSLILGQTRRQTTEITELAAATSTIQRRIQVMEAELEATNAHASAMLDEIRHTREMAKANQLLLADPTIFAKPELEIDWENIGAPEALGLCRNSQLWDHQPPSTPGMTFNMDMSRQFAAYYRNEMNEGRLTEAQARSLLRACQEDVGLQETGNTEEQKNEDGETGQTTQAP